MRSSAYARVETIGFDYGQRHAVELACRRRVRAEMARRFPAWASRLGPDHVIDIGSFGAIGDTALTSDAEIVMLASGLPSTFVPGRNLVFFTYAAALGYRRGLTTLIGGMCETDFSGYPDCRDATLRALEQAIRLGTEIPFAIETPLMWLTKAETWALAERAWRRGPGRSHHRGDPYLLSGRARRAPRLGLWLRRLPRLRAPRQGLRRVAVGEERCASGFVLNRRGDAAGRSPRQSIQTAFMSVAGWWAARLQPGDATLEVIVYSSALATNCRSDIFTLNPLYVGARS